MQLLSSFYAISFGFMVGIGGGVLSSRADIRLGDIVVSQPTDTSAFMRETGTGITEYLQYYQETWSALQLQSNPERQYQQGNLLQTWKISYDEIQKRNQPAAKLLLLLAHFDIWYELIKNSHFSSEVPVWPERTTSSGLAFRTGVKNLIGFSLLATKEPSEAIRYTQWCKTGAFIFQAQTRM
jgi:hypothetical protein